MNKEDLNRVFKAYDIRGIYPDELDEDFAYALGRAIASFLNAKTLVVGRDIRNSSKSLFNALAEGISSKSTRVIDIGESTTPMMYFSVIKLGADGGINITASHNPAEYNGFKVVRENAVPVSSATGLNEIKERTLKELGAGRINGEIHPQKKNILGEYIANAFNFASAPNAKLRVVVDAANSLGAMISPDFFSKAGASIIPLFFEIDGSFPNHEANPLKPENTKALQERVVAEGADFGVAFDGDCDRIVLIDEKGKRVSPDLVTALVSRIILRKHPHATILYDLRSSKVVREEIEKSGGKAVMCRVGHSLIKEQMRRDNGVFAGELSGHYYLANNHYIESPLVILLYIMNLMAESSSALSELVAPLKRYFSTGEINFNVKDKEGAISLIEKELKGDKPVRVLHLDGLSMEFDGWWFNLRPSNTEDLLRLNLEADTPELREEKLRLVKGLINSFNRNS